MLRFLQKPGPLKKIILGGILVVICVMMVITLVPGGLFGDYLGGGLTTQGVIAKVGDQEIGIARRCSTSPPDRTPAVQRKHSADAHALFDATGGTRHHHRKSHRV